MIFTLEKKQTLLEMLDQETSIGEDDKLIYSILLQSSLNDTTLEKIETNLLYIQRKKMTLLQTYVSETSTTLKGDVKKMTSAIEADLTEKSDSEITTLLQSLK